MEQWRVEHLVALGFPRVFAERLCDHADVEHDARDLLDAGCKPSVAYRILRGD